MSVERSFEAWEEVQRHGQDLADRLAQGFTGLIQSHINPPPFQWLSPRSSKLFDLEFGPQNFGKRDFGLVVDNNNPGIHGVSAILDIGNRIGQAGADFGACLNGMVQQFFRRLPVPFLQDENAIAAVQMDVENNRLPGDVGISVREELGPLTDRLRNFGIVENDSGGGVGDDEVAGFNLRTAGHLARPHGIINFTSTYDSRTRDVESSLVARGDLWRRVEASHNSFTPRNDNSSLFLVQFGPILIIRDATLLFPVHLSKQHLLWYGYDRKITKFGIISIKELDSVQLVIVHNRYF